jgi:hypothetical protein
MVACNLALFIHFIGFVFFVMSQDHFINHSFVERMHALEASHRSLCKSHDALEERCAVLLCSYQSLLSGLLEVLEYSLGNKSGVVGSSCLRFAVPSCDVKCDEDGVAA